MGRDAPALRGTRYRTPDRKLPPPRGQLACFPASGTRHRIALRGKLTIITAGKRFYGG